VRRAVAPMEDLRIDLGKRGAIKIAYRNGQLTVSISDRDMEVDALAPPNTDLGVAAEWFKRAAAEAEKTRPKVDSVKVAHFSVGRGYATVAYDDRYCTGGVGLCAPGDEFVPAEGERIARERLAAGLDSEALWKKVFYSEKPGHVPAPERVRRSLEFMIDAHDAPAWAKGVAIVPHAVAAAAPKPAPPTWDLFRDLADSYKYAIPAVSFPTRYSTPPAPSAPAPSAPAPDGPQFATWLIGGCAKCGGWSRDRNNYVCSDCFSTMTTTGAPAAFKNIMDFFKACDAYAVGRVKLPAR
jgi:hypothetical protein